MEHLGVKKQTLSSHENAGKFAASWRDVLTDLCEPLGIDVQSDEFKGLFNMKRSVVPTQVATE